MSTDPRDIATEAAHRDLLRVTAHHVGGASITASYFGPDRAAYVRVLRASLAGLGVGVTEAPDRLVATFLGGRLLWITLP